MGADVCPAASTFKDIQTSNCDKKKRTFTEVDGNTLNLVGTGINQNQLLLENRISSQICFTSADFM